MLLHLAANTVVAFFPIGHAELPATMRSCCSFLYQGPGALFLRSTAFLALSWTSLNRTDAKCQQLGNLRAILSQEGMIMDEQIPRSWSFVGTILRCLQWSCCLPTAVPFFPPPWFTVSWLIITSWDHFPNRLCPSPPHTQRLRGLEWWWLKHILMSSSPPKTRLVTLWKLIYSSL